MPAPTTPSTDSAAAERSALAARIARHWPTVTETLRIGPHVIDFTRVAEPDRVLEEMETTATSGAAPAWQPYWAEAWDSAVAVAEQLATMDLRGVKVLDLGCGLGLTGAISAAQGAQVTMVDAAPPALLFARLNAWPWRDRVRLRRLDWRGDGLAGESFALIVGSDILYDRQDWPYLEAFWRRHLLTDGELLLGEPGRTTGDEFPGWLEHHEWRVSVAPTAPAPDRRVIWILRCQRWRCGSVTFRVR